MNPALIASALLTLVALATVCGVLHRSAAGRVRITNGHTVISVRELPGVTGLGSGATLLQFSTEVCAPCKVTHRILDELAAERDDITHVDLDVTHRADLASKYRILQTPTTFILDRRGVVRARIGGAPRTAELRAEINRILTAA